MKKIFQPGTIFLTDGLGALLTAFSLGGILSRWEALFGMPRSVLYPLAAVGLLLAAYSLSCYFFKVKKWKSFLLGIALANLAYCLVSLTLVVMFFERLTTLGVAYFALEICVVMALVWIELKLTTGDRSKMA
ncbi:MAG TPA: hypothetical protein PLL53_14295 [Saprospiraceae bacterium]|nr:hypothetical protein [Saprospiraceae bacterium]